MHRSDRFRGSIVGLAVGDALGHATEFVSSLAAIRLRWGSEGVTDFVPSGKHPAGTFTDDTQMTVAVARALCRAGRRDLDALMELMGEEFVAWSRSPHNNRAPGGTCLAGCRNLARGLHWRDAGVKGSKGCGAAMRAAPVGLYFADDDAAMIRVAAAQSALTHSHPTGVASGVAAAAPVAWAARGGGLDGMLDYTRQKVSELSEELLVDVGCDPRVVKKLGVREMLDALDQVAEHASTEAEDVCALLGGAWVGEEAVACALWCVLRAGGDFRGAALRGANSSGDSDSIACIAGSIAGALGGIDAVPAQWVAQVEKSARLDALARSLWDASQQGDLALDPSLDLFGAEWLAVRPADLEGEHDTLRAPAPSEIFRKP